MIWGLRIVWALTPVSLWGLLYKTLKDISTPISVTLIVALGVLWFIGLLACLYPHSFSLTIIRIFAPIAWGLCIWSVLVENQSIDHNTAELIFGFTYSIVLILISFSAYIGNLFVSAEAYGNEERFLLKPPNLIQHLLMPVVWATSLVGLVAPALLLANTFWILGGILLPLGILVFIFGLRSLNSLVRRQVIFVPNGFVVSDPLRLEFPIRIEAPQVQSFAIQSRLPQKKGENKNWLNLSIGTSGRHIRVETNLPIQAYLLKTAKSTKTDKKVMSAFTLCFTPTRLISVERTAEIRLFKNLK